MLKAYSRAVARINSLRTDEEGATATEYALIIGVVSIAIVGALAALALAITGVFDDATHDAQRRQPVVEDASSATPRVGSHGLDYSAHEEFPS